MCVCVEWAAALIQSRYKGQGNRLLSYHITNSMEQGPSWEANRSLSSKVNAHVLRNTEVHYRITRARQLSSYKYNLSKFFRVTKCEICFYCWHQNWWQIISYKDTRKVVPVINSALHNEGLLENGGLDPCIRNRGIIWKQVVNLTPWAASLPGKEAP